MRRARVDRALAPPPTRERRRTSAPSRRHGDSAQATLRGARTERAAAVTSTARACVGTAGRAGRARLAEAAPRTRPFP
eukprot:scaffold929_cov387-Prasinococcus_capsulatus_cf.AAC.1